MNLSYLSLPLAPSPPTHSSKPPRTPPYLPKALRPHSIDPVDAWEWRPLERPGRATGPQERPEWCCHDDLHNHRPTAGRPGRAEKTSEIMQDTPFFKMTGGTFNLDLDFSRGSCPSRVPKGYVNAEWQKATASHSSDCFDESCPVVDSRQFSKSTVHLIDFFIRKIVCPPNPGSTYEPKVIVKNGHSCTNGPDRLTMTLTSLGLCSIHLFSPSLTSLGVCQVAHETKLTDSTRTRYHLHI